MDEARYVIFAAEARAQLRQIALIHERIDHRERENGVAGLDRRRIALLVEDARAVREPLAAEVQAFIAAVAPSDT